MSWHVYVLTNPAMPGLVKVGYTFDLERRITELSSPSGVPLRFEVAFAVGVTDPISIEAMAHAALSEKRINTRREFFECSVDVARSTINAIVQESIEGADEAADIIHANMDLDTVDVLVARLAGVSMKDFIAAIAHRRAA